MSISEREISVGSFEAAAKAASGTAVIIDVFRAFTTAAIAMENGARKILMVDDLESALDLRADGVADFALGERHGQKPEGFDFGNSPAEISAHRFDGKVLVQTTSNGTRGVIAAGGAERIFAASLVNAAATARAIAADPVPPVDLVAMGDKGPLRRDEDEICGLYLRALICSRTPDPEAVATLLRGMSDLRDTRRLSPADVAQCLMVDSVDFAIRVQRVGDQLVAIRHPA